MKTRILPSGFLCGTGAVLLLLGSITLSPSALGQTDSWNAGAGNWSVSGNWSSGVPTPSSNVVVNSTHVPPIPATITLDINATVSSLDLETLNSQMDLPGDSVLNQTAARSLTINGATTIAQSNDQLNIGAGSTVTMNGASTNNGTIFLSSVTLQVNTAPILATLNGTGTLTNNGLIQGVNNSAGSSGGNIGLNIDNTNGDIEGSLTFNGNTVTGGIYGEDISSINALTSNGATFAGVSFGGPSGSAHFSIATVNLTGGSTLILNGGTNVGTLRLGTGTTGATISAGSGPLFNIGFIEGNGTISANIFNSGEISSMGSLTLQGQIDQLSGSGFNAISLPTSTTTILDGAQILGGSITGQGGTLAAQNGATVSGVTFDGTASPIVLTGGSSLGINGGATVGGTLQLGSGTQGANLSDVSGGAQLNLGLSSTLEGGGVVGASLQGGTASIIANNAFAPLVLQGGADVKSVSVTNGATLTIGQSVITAGSFSLASGTTLNGTGTIVLPQVQSFANSGTVAPGIGGSGGTILIETDFYEQKAGAQLDVLLGGTGLGNFSQLTILNLLGNGTSTGAQFDPGSVFDVTFGSSFDPSAGCTTTFISLCESFDVFNMDEGVISGFGDITFSLPTLPTGFAWAEMVSSLGGVDQEIILEIFGEASSSGGGGGGGGGGTTTPEPETLFLLGSGLIAAALGLRKKARRRSTRA